MKRYFLFLYFDFYPSGGMEDFAGDFDSIDDIRSSIETYKQEYEDKIVYKCNGFQGENLMVWDIVENKQIPFIMSSPEDVPPSEPDLPSWIIDHGNNYYTVDIEDYKAQGGNLLVELWKIPQFARFFTNPPQERGSIEFK